jgi:hypothetical protein
VSCPTPIIYLPITQRHAVKPLTLVTSIGTERDPVLPQLRQMSPAMIGTLLMMIVVASWRKPTNSAQPKLRACSGLWTTRPVTNGDLPI